MSTEISLVKIQYGIFFKNPLTRPDLLTRKVADDFSENFDSSPINLPIPENILEFPVAQLKSENNSWQMNVSRLRADVIFNPAENKKYCDIKDEIDQIAKILIIIANEARDQKNEVSRITNISNFIKEVENPVDYLQEIFFKEKNKNQSELHIRFNEQIKKGDNNYNNITHYETGTIVRNSDGSEKPGILIMKDFNTDPKQKDLFKNEDIDVFMQDSKEHSHQLDIE